MKKIEKIEIACPICQSSEFSLLYKDELGDKLPPLDYNFNEDTRKTFQIVKCNTCDLIYTNPLPLLSPHYQDTVDNAYLVSSKQRLKTADHLVNVLRKYKKSGTLLDVGCNTGFMLDSASRFYSVEGLETSQWSFSIASQKHKVYNSTLGDFNVNKTYDIVTLLGVIEHFEHPDVEINKISNLINPGGIFLIYTGDVDALIPKILGKKWWWFQGMHLYYFSYKTLKRLVEKYGFKVIKKQNHIVYFQLFSLANSLSRYAILKPIASIFRAPIIRDIMVPLKISGEMLLICEKK